jgi:hypothetical protein
LPCWQGDLLAPWIGPTKNQLIQIVSFVVPKFVVEIT